MKKDELLTENKRLKKLVDIGESMAGVMYNYSSHGNADASARLRKLMRHWLRVWDKAVLDA